MTNIDFISQNAHFAINLFAALVFFAVFWLYFDASASKRRKKTIFKATGFFLVAVSFLVHGTTIEESIFGESVLGIETGLAVVLMRIAGYGAIIISELLDPLQKVPHNTGINAMEFDADLSDVKNIGVQAEQKKSFAVASVGFGNIGGLLHLLQPVGALTISILYWRRATKGLERHLKPIAIAFFVVTLSEIVSLASLWQASENPAVANLTAAFGVLWVVEHVLLLIGTILVCVWVWKYLIERLFSQIFMILLTVTVGVFLITATAFTYLLQNNVRDEALNNLRTASSVLQYAIDGKKAETFANAKSLSENPAFISAIANKDTTELEKLTGGYLDSKQLYSVMITDSAGQVLFRAEDPGRYGDSVSSDTQVHQALTDKHSSNIVLQNGVLAPQVSIKSTVPVHDSGGIVIGTISTNIVLDSAFVDGIKNATGLNSSIYANDVRSATTFRTADATTRYVGIKDTNTSVAGTVLKDGNTYAGPVSVLNQRFLGVYAPLKDIDNATLGMLFIGVPESSIAKTAGKSVESIFVLTTVLLVLMILPAYLLSKYISKQLR